VYSKSRLNFDEHCAQGKIELLKENLTDLKKQTITITLDKQVRNLRIATVMFRELVSLRQHFS